MLKANENAPIAKVSVVDQGRHARNAPSDQAGGLQQTLYLFKGAKVMLTCNLNAPVGLFNGSMGEVVDIIYPDGRSPKESLPGVVMVAFDKYTGPKFIPRLPKVVQIVPVERRIDCGCHGCKKKTASTKTGVGHNYSSLRGYDSWQRRDKQICCH